MQKNRLICLGIWSSLLVLFLYQNTFKTLVVLLFFTLILILDILLFFIESKKFDLNIKVVANPQLVNQLEGIITFNGNNQFPFIRSEIILAIRNQLTGAVIKKKLIISPSKFNQNKCEWDIVTKYSGNITFEIEDVRFTDIFGLFSSTNKSKLVDTSYLSLPDTVDINFDHSSLLSIQHSSEFLSDKKNAESGDMVDFKAYELGDPVKNIHWKLSLKEQELIVKELSEESDKKQLILVETNYLINSDRAKEDELDALLVTYSSLMNTLINQDLSFSIGWFNSQNKQLNIDNISSREEYYLILNSLEHLQYKESDKLVLDQFEERFDLNSFAKVIYISPNANSVNIPNGFIGDFKTIIISNSKFIDKDETNFLLKPEMIKEELLALTI